MRAILLNPPKRRRRGKRRNASHWIPAYGYGESMIEGENPRRKRRGRRGKRRNASHWIPAYGYGESMIEGENPRRRGRRRSMRYNRRHGRRSRRRNATFDYGTGFTRKNASTWIPAFKNPYWVPRYAQNPMGMVKKAFSVKALVQTTPVVIGGLSHVALSTYLKNQPWMPTLLKGKVGETAVDLGSAAAIATLTGIIAKKQAPSVLMGGMVMSMIGLINRFTGWVPKSGFGECIGCLGDYATTADARGAVSLG